jgi:hypothetical protein
MTAAFQHIMSSMVGTLNRIISLDNLEIYAEEQPVNPEATATRFVCKVLTF